MKGIALLLGVLAVLAVLGTVWRRYRSRSRRVFIDGYAFAPHLRDAVRSIWPQLDERALRDIEKGLRQFFRVSLAADGQKVAMPSKAADALWHALILDTARYQFFCRKAFGRLLHHTPAEVMRAQAHGAEPLRRAWRLSCRDEGLDPRQAAALPLLFALDSALAIPGGFRYVPDCSRVATDGAWCGNELGCSSSGCGADGSDGGGDGGGCGGGGD